MIKRKNVKGSVGASKYYEENLWKKRKYSKNKRKRGHKRRSDEK